MVNSEEEVALIIGHSVNISPGQSPFTSTYAIHTKDIVMKFSTLSAALAAAVLLSANPTQGIDPLGIRRLCAGGCIDFANCVESQLKAMMRQPTFTHFLRSIAIAACLLMTALAQAQSPDLYGDDPFKSLQWLELKKEFAPGAKVVFDDRVKVSGPRFADDPMNVPISIAVEGLSGVQKIMVVVDRNPIRKVLEYFPVDVLPSLSFRFKLEQASPVRAFAQTADGVWHVGGAWVDSAGGGCTVPGATRADGSWPQTLGQVAGKLFAGEAPAQSTPNRNGPASDSLSRLKFRVMHPMDTGLVSGIPAFYINKLQVNDLKGKTLLRINVFEPVSENPVFSFDFPSRGADTLVLTGTDNNGNRVNAQIQ